MPNIAGLNEFRRGVVGWKVRVANRHFPIRAIVLLFNIEHQFANDLWVELHFANRMFFRRRAAFVLGGQGRL